MKFGKENKRKQSHCLLFSTPLETNAISRLKSALHKDAHIKANDVAKKEKRYEMWGKKIWQKVKDMSRKLYIYKYSSQFGQRNEHNNHDEYLSVKET